MFRTAPGLLCLVLAWSTQARADDLSQRGDQQIVIGRLPCNPPGDVRSHGLRQLVWELQKRTSVEARLEPLLVDPASQAIFRTPLLVWSCEGAAADLDDGALANLRRFLTMGGTLWVDDPAAQPDGPFDRSVRHVLTRIFPRRALRPVSPEHVLYKTFFLLRGPGGRRLANPDILAVGLGDRLAVVYTQNDLLGALAKDLVGGWEHVVEGGSHQREAALFAGINIVFYAVCLDYKNDRVHLPFILKRRRL
ncbi:MAG: DUF4159 domain-containing protein [Deltaproteobacteria bacterium]|nr:DUF4159 domain-containing protein [Deltaproteobacteria bacterium]